MLRCAAMTASLVAIVLTAGMQLRWWRRCIVSQCWCCATLRSRRSMCDRRPPHRRCPPASCRLCSDCMGYRVGRRAVRGAHIVQHSVCIHHISSVMVAAAAARPFQAAI
eukprot:5435459-Pleurochrysis_carterae.AAC.2